jgi:trimethylamine--corrinoid protein Co-methyltransferase
MQFAEFLIGREVEQIHEASLEILENVGILVRNENARGIYAKHSCHVDSKSLIVKIPRDVIEDHRKSFVPHFTFMGRDPQCDRMLPGDRPVIVTASSAPNVIDPHNGEERRGTSTDIANIAFLINDLNAGRRRARGSIQPFALLSGIEKLPEACPQQYPEHERIAGGTGTGDACRRK